MKAILTDPLNGREAAHDEEGPSRALRIASCVLDVIDHADHRVHVLTTADRRQHIRCATNRIAAHDTLPDQTHHFAIDDRSHPLPIALEDVDRNHILCPKPAELSLSEQAPLLEDDQQFTLHHLKRGIVQSETLETEDVTERNNLVLLVAI